MRLHTIDANDYADTARYNFLSLVERDVSYAYVDTAFYQQRRTGIPTIGVGINLQVHGKLILQALGFDLDGSTLKGAALTAEQGYINQLLAAFNKEYPSDNTVDNQALAAFNAILQQRASNAVYTDPANFVSQQAFADFQRASQFILPSSDVSRQLLNDVLDGYTVPGQTFGGYEGVLNTWLTRTGVGGAQPDLLIHDSNERLVLLSLAFNSRTYASDQPGTPWDDRGLPTLLGPRTIGDRPRLFLHSCRARRSTAFPRCRASVEGTFNLGFEAVITEGVIPIGRITDLLDACGVQVRPEEFAVMMAALHIVTRESEVLLMGRDERIDSPLAIRSIA
jgi:hypothetical protein